MSVLGLDMGWRDRGQGDSRRTTRRAADSEFRALPRRVIGRARPGHDGEGALWGIRPGCIRGPYRRTQAARNPSRRAARPDDPTRENDDDQRDQPAEQRVGEKMPAEGDAQQARADAERERDADRRAARRAAAARIAGATIQKPEAASPETNEQFIWQAPSKRYQGRNSSVPPNSTT